MRTILRAHSARRSETGGGRQGAGGGEAYPLSTPLRCIHHLKSDLYEPYAHIGYWTLIRLSVDITFALIIHLRPVPCGNQAYRSGVGPILSVVSVVVSGIGRGWSCRARIGQPKGRGRSGRARFERGCIRNTARIQRLLIEDIRSSIKAGNFLPDHTRPSHKNRSAFVGGWSAGWCECSFSPENKSISGSHETVEKKKNDMRKKSRAHEIVEKKKMTYK